MDINSAIGDFGRTQKELAVLCIIRSFLLAVSMVAIYFTVGELDHWCSAVPPFDQLSSTEWRNCCLPHADVCKRFDVTSGGDIDNETLVDCESFEYESKRRYASLTQEWDLVCDRQWYIPLLYITFFAGCLLFYPFCGYFSDRFGRKTSLLIGSTSLCLLHFVTAFATSIEYFLTTRFLIGCFYAFLQSSPLTLYLEYCGPKQRSLVPLLTSGAWAVSSFLILVGSWYLSNWRHYFLIASVGFFLPFSIMTWILIPESIRLLVVNGKYERAEEELLKVAKRNGIVVVDKESVMAEITGKIESMNRGKKTNYIRDKLFVTTLAILILSRFSLGFVLTGFQITLRHLGQNFEVKYAVLTVALLISSILDYGLQVSVKSRRRVLLGITSLSGTCFLIAFLVPADLQWVRLGLAFISRVCQGQIFTNITLCVSELLPTNIREFGMNLCHAGGRVGGTLSPLIIILGQSMGESSPYLLFGLFDILTAALLFFLPEYLKQSLPDTLEESKTIVKQEEDSCKTPVTA